MSDLPKSDLFRTVEKELFLPAYGYTDGSIIALSAYTACRLADGLLRTCAFNFKVPDDFVSFVRIEAIWVTFSAAAGLDMYWRMVTRYGASGEVYISHTETPAYGVTSTGGPTVLNVQSPANPITFADLALGDIVGVEFDRDATNVADTLSDNADILGLLFIYTGRQIR